MTNNILKYTGQLILLGLFMAVLMVFSNSPAYTHFPQDKALIKVSLSHAGQIKGKCRKRSKEELANLPPNMRQDMDCPRERSAVRLELELDGVRVLHESLLPTGLRRDGSSSAYHRIEVDAGQHHLVARLKDHEQLKTFNYSKEIDVKLAPGQVYVVDFEHDNGGFIFR